MNGAEQLYRVCWREYGPGYDGEVFSIEPFLIGEAIAEILTFREKAPDNILGRYMADYWLEPV